LKYCRVEYAGNSAIFNEAANLLPRTIYIGYCTISNNSTYNANGGGIYTQYGSAIITNNTILNNVTDGKGGGIYNESSAAITNNTIANNSAAAGYGGGGGGICNGGLATITNNTISNNSTGSANAGGGIFSYYGSATISGNTITSNTAYGSAGGGIYAASATITNNTISNNSAGVGGGGGIYCEGGDIITNNIISNNSASQGGGISAYNSTIRYNTITDTTASAIATFSVSSLIRTNNIYATGYAVYNSSTNDMDARYNYWNSVNADTINARMFDFFEDFTKGIVNCKPFLAKAFSDTVSPSAPLNLTGANGPNDSTFVINWTNPIDPSGISEYYFKRGGAPTSNFDTTGRFHAAPDTVFSAGENLYVWLVDSSGNLNYRNNDSVTLTPIAIRAGKNSAAIRLSFSVTSGRFLTGSVLRYDLPEKANVSLALFDISGRLVKTMFSGTRERGCYTQTLQENELPAAGMYYVRFRAGEFSSVKRLAVLR
jgi:parallel beta-helix repeat protein